MSASSSQPSSSQSPQPELPRAYSRLLAEMPRLRAEVVAPDGAETWVGDAAREALSDASFLGDRVNAGRSMFPMPEVNDDTRFQVQLWWYSLCGSWFGPAVASIVVMGEAPRAEWAATRMFARDGYWLGFTADGFDECDNMDADAFLWSFISKDWTNIIEFLKRFWITVKFVLDIGSYESSGSFGL